MKKGYTFKGWYSDSKYTKRVTQIKAGSTGNVKVYAKWAKISVKKTSIQSLKSSTSRTMKVGFKKVSGADGYVIHYSTNSKMKSAKTITTKSTVKTVKSLKSGKKYYVQVRAYKLDSVGKKVYGSYSSVKSVKIK